MKDLQNALFNIIRDAVAAFLRQFDLWKAILRTLFVVFFTSFLTACAIPPPIPREADPVRDQCEYEATIATQNSGSGNPLMQGYELGRIFGMCMKAKGR